MGARYYDPQVGRFITPDPIGGEGGLNIYQYCMNDPINYIDPYGLVWMRTKLWFWQGTKAHVLISAMYNGIISELGYENIRLNKGMKHPPFNAHDKCYSRLRPDIFATRNGKQHIWEIKQESLYASTTTDASLAMYMLAGATHGEIITPGEKLNNRCKPVVITYSNDIQLLVYSPYEGAIWYEAYKWVDPEEDLKKVAEISTVALLILLAIAAGVPPEAVTQYAH